METTNFSGTFAPPRIGFSSVPIRIIGDGSCELTTDGLWVRGFKDIRLTSDEAVKDCLWLFLCLVFTLAGLFIFLFAGFGLLVRLIYRFVQQKVQGKPIELVIPWDRVSYIRGDAESGALVIHVKKLRSSQGSYKGELFFLANDPEAFLSGLMSYGIKGR